MAGVKELMQLTGKGRQAVTTAIDKGDLPGYRLGNGLIWVPDEAVEDLRKGLWVPPKKRKEFGLPTTSFLHRRSGA